MDVKILGPGCANCHSLQRRTQEALTRLGIAAEVSAVTDYPTILGHGVLSTPALVVDDRVVVAGRVPTTAQLVDLLTASPG